MCYVDDCDAEQHQLEKIRVLDSPEDAKFWSGKARKEMGDFPVLCLITGGFC